MVRITIDLDPSELQLAAQLIEALRGLTDQLQVRQSAPSQPPASTPALTSLTQRQESIVGSRHPPGFGPPASTASSITHPSSLTSYVPSPIQLPPVPVPGVGRSKAISSYSGQVVRLQTVNASRDVDQLMVYGCMQEPTTCQAILLSFTDSSRLDQVATSLSAYLAAKGMSPSEAVAELVECFESVAYPAYSAGTFPDLKRVERYCQLTNHKLPDAFDTEFRKGVLQRVLRALTRERHPPYDRLEILPYAVGFAVLARMECIKMIGALATIERLLPKPANVCAAITMLGEVLSFCGPMVLTNRDALDKIWTALDHSTEARDAAFVHDMEYFNSWRSYVQAYGESPTHLQYTPVPDTAPLTTTHSTSNGHQSTGMGSAAYTGPLQLQAKVVLTLPSPGTCLAWDMQTGSAIVAGEGSLSAWRISGTDNVHQAIARFDPPPGHAGRVSAISTGVGRGQVLVAGSTSSDTNYLALHDVSARLPRRFHTLRHPGSEITSVLLLPSSAERGVSCETWSTGQHCVCLWDIPNTATAGVLDKPLHTWQDAHSMPVACTVSIDSQYHLFGTGALDGTVKLWDARLNKSAGRIVMPGGQLAIHSGGISALDTQGNMLLSAGHDGVVCLWDIRQIGSSGTVPTLSIKVEEPGVPLFKLAYRNAPSQSTAALASASGMSLLDWTDTGNPTMAQTIGYGANMQSNPLQLHDVTWAPGAAPNGGVGLLGISRQPALTVFHVFSASV